MQSPLRHLVLARGMGHTCCMARFLKQVDFPGSFFQGKAAPHPPVTTVKGLTLLPWLQGEPMPFADLSQEAWPRIREGEALQPGPPPCRRATGARTWQGGTDQTPKLSALVDAVQRAERPFPDLPEGCCWISAFPGPAPVQHKRAACTEGASPPRPHPLPALQPLRGWEPAAFWG